ncbi:MAG: hypothetical protein ACOCZ8_03760 [Bacteroidota bacterium]
MRQIALTFLYLVLILTSLSGCKDDDPNDPLVGRWQMQRQTYDNGFGEGEQLYYDINGGGLFQESMFFDYVFFSNGRFGLGVPDSLIAQVGTEIAVFGDYNYTPDAATLTFPPDVGFAPENRTWNVEQLDETNLVLTLTQEVDNPITPEPGDVAIQTTRETWLRVE